MNVGKLIELLEKEDPESMVLIVPPFDAYAYTADEVFNENTLEHNDGEAILTRPKVYIGTDALDAFNFVD